MPLRVGLEGHGGHAEQVSVASNSERAENSLRTPWPGPARSAASEFPLIIHDHGTLDATQQEVADLSQFVIQPLGSAVDSLHMLTK